ncbi:hypothetical protein ABID08_005324 [Rhizobium binae]|uniref:Uncharacterized protein n=1 Tax=Rhizobium binae TaxID=1138190 RepID=A0ABV2MNA9_9HYPH
MVAGSKASVAVPPPNSLASSLTCFSHRARVAIKYAVLADREMVPLPVVRKTYNRESISC